MKRGELKKVFEILSVIQKHPKGGRCQLIKLLDDSTLKLFTSVIYNILKHPLLIESKEMQRRKRKHINTLKEQKNQLRRLIKAKSGKTIKSTLIQSGDGIISSIIAIAIPLLTSILGGK